MPLTSAETIRKRTINSPEIKIYVSEQIENLDAMIQETSLSSNRVDYEVPRDLHVNGLKKADVQRIVYYLLSKEIIKAGFTLEITFKPKMIFHVSWVADMDQEDADEIDKFLIKLAKKPDKARQPKTPHGKKKQNSRKNIDTFDDDGLELDLNDFTGLD